MNSNLSFVNFDVVLEIALFKYGFESWKLRFVGILSHAEILVHIFIPLLLFLRDLFLFG